MCSSGQTDNQSEQRNMSGTVTFFCDWLGGVLARLEIVLNRRRIRFTFAANESSETWTGFQAMLSQKSNQIETVHTYSFSLNKTQDVSS